jgi:hypothetical protein
VWKQFQQLRVLLGGRAITTKCVEVRHGRTVREGKGREGKGREGARPQPTLLVSVCRLHRFTFLRVAICDAVLCK